MCGGKIKGKQVSHLFVWGAAADVRHFRHFFSRRSLLKFRNSESTCCQKTCQGRYTKKSPSQIIRYSWFRLGRAICHLSPRPHPFLEFLGAPWQGEYKSTTPQGIVGKKLAISWKKRPTGLRFLCVIFLIFGAPLGPRIEHRIVLLQRLII
jgi:hypothetical protein